MISEARKCSNDWLKPICAEISGNVLSIGSGNDKDKQGSYYRNYFPKAESYTTSEISGRFKCDLILNVTCMNQISDGIYDCIFCSGVLEHVFDFYRALAEITRILKPGGVLLLGTPFRQAIHMKPNDFWRFTKFGLQKLLERDYEIVEIAELCPHERKSFPETYWTRAIKKGNCDAV